MKELDDYFTLQKEIYDYFGYVEDWCVFPLDDRRDYTWKFDDDINPSSVLFFDAKGEEFGDEIMHNRFLPRSVWDGEEFTMILVDTHTDGNKFLAIYANDKRLRE